MTTVANFFEDDAAPIVSRAGALKDAIIDANETASRVRVTTGARFSTPLADNSASAARLAERLFQDEPIH